MLLEVNSDCVNSIWCGDSGKLFSISFEILVSWKLTTIPILFGNDIRLKCTAKGSGDCFGSRIFIWIGGPEQKVISFDVQVYDSKYKVFHERGNYWLVIKNSTIRDIDIPYACHCGFYYLESILKNVSTIHSSDKDKDDQEKSFINHTEEYTGDKGRTEFASTIVGSCFGALLGVFIVTLILYAIYKRNKEQLGGSNNTQIARQEQDTLILNGNRENITEGGSNNTKKDKHEQDTFILKGNGKDSSDDIETWKTEE
ncbi:Hypothetical predicted protein [Mytilus galloprovincialis]|uniref:Uncharacterized protein n=1 Tax=Mytilus galloprovincialis TaxID=29158 RepID=A0A8B6FZJ7_MYTGA|nr:Hypothetical predicted protein [Mytilus galloprovincialis]